VAAVAERATTGSRPTDRPEQRRNVSGWRAADVYVLIGSFISALSINVLLFTQLTPASGLLGFLAATYVTFLVLYALLSSQDVGGPLVRDRLVAVVVQTTALVALIALASVIIYTVGRGLAALHHLNFFTQDMVQAGPLQPLTVGGIAHAAVGTLWMISIALAICIPLGLACAVFLSEVPGRLARFVRTITEAMTALPSIVAGLFIYATLILTLGFNKSGLAAAMAISVMMLPIIIRSADVVIRLVPGSLKEASYSLGAGQWRTVRHVVLPTARSGLTTSVILGSARGIGETSPVLLTAGFTAALNTDPLHGPMVSLPLFIFETVQSPEHTMIERGFGAGAVLLLLVLILFTIARIIGGRGPQHVTLRQERRRTTASMRDLKRMTGVEVSSE
jgi:phosphate transport system permease protein